MRFSNLAAAVVPWLVGAVMMPAPARAQGFKWWQTEQFKQELGLTSDQSQRIEDLYQSTLPKLRAAKQDLDRLEAELSQLIAGNNVEEAPVLRQIDRVEQARSELSKTRTLMLIRMRRVLSPEQRTKFSLLHEQWGRPHKGLSPRTRKP